MKKIFRKLHLWLSIPFGLVLTLICFSGAMLVFEPEVMEWGYPARYFVDTVREESLPIGKLVQAVHEQLPDSLSIAGVQIPNNPKRNYRMSFAGRNRMAALYVDPYTGDIRHLQQGVQQNFFTAMRQLHRWLLDDFKRDGSFSLGKTVVGVSTLLFVFVLLSGIIIWVPKTKKALALRLQIKTRYGWRRFWHDLHVAGGIYAALLLLAMALTGLTYSFSWYRNGFYRVFGAEPPQMGQRGGGRPQSGSISYQQWQTVVDQLKKQYPNCSSITIQDGKASVSLSSLGNSRAADSYAFDAQTGDITEATYYKDTDKSGKMRGWIYAVHVGSWGGMATRILAFLAALLGATLPLTGYYMWIKRLWSRSRQKAMQLKRQ
jgi:uncharacterized iron-regulated membrane protein